MTCCVLSRRKCILMFSKSKSVNSRTQKKGGSPCAELLKESLNAIKPRESAKTMLATAKRLLANGKLMLKEIAECSGLSLAQVKKLQASMA